MEEEESLKIDIEDLKRDEVAKWILKFGAYSEITRENIESLGILEIGDEPIVLSSGDNTMALVVRAKPKKADITLSLEKVVDAVKILGKDAVLKVYKDKPAIITNEQGDISIVVAPRVEEEE